MTSYMQLMHEAMTGSGEGPVHPVPGAKSFVVADRTVGVATRVRSRIWYAGTLPAKVKAEIARRHAAAFSQGRDMSLRTQFVIWLHDTYGATLRTSWVS
jgi:hypothetical protein